MKGVDTLIIYFVLLVAISNLSHGEGKPIVESFLSALINGFVLNWGSGIRNIFLT